MKALNLRLWVSALVVVFGLMTAAPATAADEGEVGDLKLAISGCASDRGEIKIALVASAEEFSFEREPTRRVVAEVLDGKSQWVFPALPHGEYAIKVYHDENGNDELDKNFLGIPKEDVGCSNNPSMRFGEPSYDETKFSFESSTMTVDIEVR